MGLKELIAINPVALIWVGAFASTPIVAFSLMTPMATARGKLAQSYVIWMYTPLVLMQVAFLYFLHNMEFKALPRLYLMGFVYLLSIPCFTVWCACMMFASRYCRQDRALVEKQRQERAREASQRS